MKSFRSVHCLRMPVRHNTVSQKLYTFVLTKKNDPLRNLKKVDFGVCRSSSFGMMGNAGVGVHNDHR